MDRVDAKPRHDLKEQWRKDDHQGQSLHDGAEQQQEDVDDQENDILVVEMSSN